MAHSTRLEYLLTVELLFQLKPAVLTDLEAMVSHILYDRSKNHPEKVAA